MGFLAGTDLAFTIPLTDDGGAAFVAASAEFRVLDGEHVQLTPYAPVPGFVAGSGSALVTVLAAQNALPAGVVEAAREIELRCTLADSSRKLVVKTYTLQAETGTLVRGVNTIVTLASADMLADRMTAASSWLSSNRKQKIAALIEAYGRLSKLRLIPLDNFYYDRGSNPFRAHTATSLADLSVSEVMELDGKLLDALAHAQVAEADVILSGDPIAARRREGLILDTIGEVKQMFRGGKPLELPVSRRALDYLSAYVSLGAKVVGRG